MADNHSTPAAHLRGCRAGDACPFLHDPSVLINRDAGASAPSTTQGEGGPSKGPHATPHGASDSQANAPERPVPIQKTKRQYVPPPVDKSKVVQKPVPRAQAEDPREFQIQQLRRRFSPKEIAEDNGTAFAFSMAPSDPDFPFDMVGLECVLHVPTTYLKGRTPSLDVKNKEMGRGYQINVERGFDALVSKSPHLALLGLMNALDKQLESLLTGQKAETIKIVPNARSSSDKPVGQSTSTPRHAEESKAKPVEKPSPAFTAEQRTSAAARREMETGQLEARLQRLPLFFKSSDGIAYTLPIEPRKRVDLPVPLHAVKTVRLFVPLLYPLQPCRVEIQGVNREAALNTENGFEKRAREHPETTLMGHVNYLTQNMHLLATEPVEEDHSEVLKEANIATLQLEDHSSPVDSKDKLSKQAELLDDRSHVHVIPRPPEWVSHGPDGEEDGDSSEYYDSGDEYTDDSGVELDTIPESTRTAPERGVLLSFPYLELHGIELLELVSLCITIKCERCKDQLDVKNLRNTTTATGDVTGARIESCKKCASSLSVGYRKELMHVTSVRAGYLDLDGCTVTDMLPR
ncbi:hypothetical protein MMC30_002510 [Trapelia coarctata]|nr:hypothetical protein [Trapelia coarctata]